MDAIYIPILTKAPDRTEVVRFKAFLDDLPTLMPVQGELQVTHQGNYLEVTAKIETIVTLTCNRCLQQYNYRLKIKPSELIWLEESSPQVASSDLEIETPFEELVETLPPNGYFEPDTWLYEQLCLAIPSKQLCDSNCEGISISEGDRPESQIDSRWAALNALKGKLPQ
jgi:uncharacterized protein